MLGIAQEHHADRCRLFAQWQGFDFPILHDPINVMGAAGVPIVVAIDERGIVRAVRFKPEELDEVFLDKTFEEDAVTAKPIKPEVPNIDALYTEAKNTNSADAWRELGDALALWHSPERITEAIGVYSKAMAIEPGHAPTLFRMGVCYSMRNESGEHVPGDFQRAIDKWTEALEANPNQYIWRRRLQQYGPLSGKPYPFYDWTEQAAKEIRARGEEPVALRVSLTASEAAQPAKDFRAASTESAEPDPKGRILRDTTELAKVEVAVVPPRAAPGSDVRVHVEFRLNTSLKAHWNNEAQPLQLWLDLPEGWQSTNRLFSAPQPEKTESNETRRFDFGLRIPAGTPKGQVDVPAYALYYVCEDIRGTCVFVRQDTKIKVQVKQK